MLLFYLGFKVQHWKNGKQHATYIGYADPVPVQLKMAKEFKP